MDDKSLAKELQELLSDKAEQTEYVQSLQLQIMRFKVSLQILLYVVILVEKLPCKNYALVIEEETVL